jgi:hypothetical protein
VASGETQAVGRAGRGAGARRRLTIACRRPPIASAPASLRLSAAPEAQRSAPNGTRRLRKCMTWGDMGKILLTAILTALGSALAFKYKFIPEFSLPDTLLNRFKMSTSLFFSSTLVWETSSQVTPAHGHSVFGAVVHSRCCGARGLSPVGASSVATHAVCRG